MEVITRQNSLNKITLEKLLDYINKNCCNRQQFLEEIIIDSDTEIADIKVNPINFKDQLKSANQPILFCPKFLSNFEYFKTNQDLLVFNINSLDLTPNLSISSKKSTSDYDNNFKTLFMSLLYCFTETNKITDKLLEEFIINTNKHVQMADFAKLNMKKIKLNKTLKSHKVDLDIIRFVSDYLHINIFLFDETINANKIIYCSGDFIPYKKCIVLYHDEDTYYPVITSNYKVFKFEQSVVKFMLSDISRIVTHDNTVFNLVTEVLDSYINKDIAQLIEDNIKIPINKPEETASVVNGFDDEYSPTEKEVESDNDSDHESDAEANNKLEEYMTYSLKDLQKLAKDNNIDIKNKLGKFKTKKELAEDLI